MRTSWSLSHPLQRVSLKHTQKNKFQFGTFANRSSLSTAMKKLAELASLRDHDQTEPKGLLSYQKETILLI